MEIAYSPHTDHADSDGATLVLGNFDGVHVGHRALIDRAKEYARPVGAVTFEPHPRQFFEPDRPHFRLCSAGEKLKRLHSAGCDFVVVVPFDEARAAQSAFSFVRDTINRDLRAGYVVVGQDFAFGKGRGGSGQMLQCLAPRFGFGVEIVPKLQVGGEYYSSSLARRNLAAGRVGLTATALGHPWQVMARVNHIRDGMVSIELLAGECLLPPSGDYLVAIGANGRGWRNMRCRLEADFTAQFEIACEERDMAVGMTLNLAFLSRLAAGNAFPLAVQSTASAREVMVPSMAMGGW